MFRIALISALAVGLAGTGALALSFAHSGGSFLGLDLPPASPVAPVLRADQGADALPLAHTESDAGQDAGAALTQAALRPAGTAPPDHFVTGEAPVPVAAPLASPRPLAAAEPLREAPAPHVPQISFQPKNFAPLSTGVFR